MENVIEELKKLSIKIEEQNKESILDKIIKILEKVLLPAAVIFLSYQSIQLTTKLESVQHEIAQAALEETQAENKRSEKESLMQLEMNYIGIIYSDLTSKEQDKINNAINLIEILGYEFAMKFTKLSSKLNILEKNKEDLKTIAKEKVAIKEKQENQDSEVLIVQLKNNKSLNNNPIETIKIENELNQIESDNNDKINSRLETYSKNKKVITALSDQNHTGNKDELNNVFWELYWGDMTKYENKEIESHMVRFGKELKSQNLRYDVLTSIAEELINAMNLQTSSSNWIKEGYYRFYNDLKILLVSLDNKKKEANFKIKTSGNIIITESKLKIGEVFQFKFDGLEYELKLNSIDKAGKNPFTKASYYTIRDLN